MRSRFGFSLILVAACGAPPIPALPSVPPRVTRAKLAGASCTVDRCTCLAPGDPASLPSVPGHKRFEIRLGPVANELWLQIDEAVLYKSPETAEACFYLDLAPGAHNAALRARDDNAFAAKVRISELSAEGQLGYDTFTFECGGPDPCELRFLRSFAEYLSTVRRNLHDPCGSTKVRKVHWDTGRTPDRRTPTELLLELVLDVYEFSPAYTPHAPECTEQRQKNRQRPRRDAT